MFVGVTDAIYVQVTHLGGEVTAGAGQWGQAALYLAGMFGGAAVGLVLTRILAQTFVSLQTQKRWLQAQGAEGAQFPSARGANPEAHHGPLGASVRPLNFPVRRRMRLFVAILIAAVAPGAAVATSAADAARQLEQAEQLWARAGPKAYSYSVKYSEFVSTHGCERQRYRVLGSHSIALAAVNTTKCKFSPKLFGSVPALFRLAHDLLGNEEIEFSFDPVLGYPRSIYAGVADMTDAYFAFDVSEFTDETPPAPPNNRWRGP